MALTHSKSRVLMCAIVTSLFALSASEPVRAGDAAASAGIGRWQAGDTLVYDVTQRERRLDTPTDVSEVRKRMTLTVVDVARRGRTSLVDLREDDCVRLASAASDPVPARSEGEVFCALPLRVRLADNSDAVGIPDIKAVRARVHADETARVAATLGPKVNFMMRAFMEETIAQRSSESAIVAEARDRLRLFHLPPRLLPATFTDTRPGPADEGPLQWTHVIEWLPPDATGQRRARWRMTPDPDAVRQGIRAQWEEASSAEVSKDSPMGRVLAGDFDMRVITDYTFDATGRVVHALEIRESRLADRHTRREREARLRTSP
ncbi:hypothetical protein [Luteimonas sp. 3794]|uniref:hypothetical protein n=1 Tax=Luteimonas sp. 3794 TaxID=2817730 RepID=UPI0028562BD6|nr:hypothetical protein [Luteimonas sp. 3794]MDR6992916.1 hypothetical protein [Luteimonas sp. 3794]